MNASCLMYIRFGKRLFDLILTIPALIILLPILGIIALLVRIKLGSPIFFCQLRPGLHGKTFFLYKFRTMIENRNEKGNPLLDSERLTPFGCFLRKTSLDELPELFNVLRGEMSLVGPRPLLIRYMPYIREFERIRFSIRPGITGLAQIIGRNDLPWEERFRLDAEYARNITFFNDIHIICLTLARVVQCSGVQVDPGRVMLDLDKEREKKPLG